MGLPEILIDGEVIEVKPPHELVQTYRFLFNDAHKEEGFCRVTVTHDTADAPMMSGATRGKFDLKGGGGWNWILSDLKSLLETGETMDARELNPRAGNGVWRATSCRPISTYRRRVSQERAVFPVSRTHFDVAKESERLAHA
jgi:hypothetical protein